MCFVRGDNSCGKTSLAEAIEFLLCGKTARRDVMATTKTEFANLLRNAHFSGEVFVEADIEHGGSDGEINQLTVRRLLVADYPNSNQDCASELQRLDPSGEWSEWSFEEIGLPTWADPIALPMIFQHTLRFICGARPTDRRDYFRRALDVGDISRLRDVIRETAAGLSIDPTDETVRAVVQRASTLALDEGFERLGTLLRGSPSSEECAQCLAAVAQNALAHAGEEVPPEVAREKVFAVASDILSRSREEAGIPSLRLQDPSTGWITMEAWDGEVPGVVSAITEAKSEYDAHNRPLDEDTCATVRFLGAGLQLPEFQASFSGRKECPFCLTEAMSWERILAIRGVIQTPERINTVRDNLYNQLRALSVRAAELRDEVERQMPVALEGLDPEIVKPMIQGSERIWEAWSNAICNLRTLRKALLCGLERAVSILTRASVRVRAGRELSLASLPDGVAAIRRRVEAFVASRAQYSELEPRITPLVNAAIDAQSGCQQLASLAEIWDNRRSLRAGILERSARRTVRDQLQNAGNEIAEANAVVLTLDKFPALNVAVSEWWRTLRPDESVNFGEIIHRGRALRDFDIQATIVDVTDQASASVERHAQGVFSDSQLNCLGLSVFFARTQREGPGFIIMDDPIQSLDREHADSITLSVIEKLVEDAHLQVILLTHDVEFWGDLMTHYAARDPKGAKIHQRNDGVIAIEDTDSRLDELLRVIHRVVRVPNEEVFELSGNKLRIAAEVFCKEIIVKYGDPSHGGDLPSHFSGEMLGKLIPKAEPHLTVDPSHSGKLRYIERRTNPSSHDCVRYAPGETALKVMYGNLKKMAREYGLL